MADELFADFFEDPPLDFVVEDFAFAVDALADFDCSARVLPFPVALVAVEVFEPPPALLVPDFDDRFFAAEAFEPTEAFFAPEFEPFAAFLADDFDDPFLAEALGVVLPAELFVFVPDDLGWPDIIFAAESPAAAAAPDAAPASTSVAICFALSTSPARAPLFVLVDLLLVAISSTSRYRTPLHSYVRFNTNSCDL